MVKHLASKAPSQRQLRVAEEIRHVLGRMMSQNDLFIDGLKPSLIMITEVQISPDLAYATVFVRGIGDVDTTEQVALLNDHKGPFRYRVGKSIRLRIVPNLIFREDSAFEESDHITAILNHPTVRADIEKYREDEEIDVVSDGDTDEE
ncbi:MAG: 30S ribosome-binding factor RbfA [Alphaproteobacteria bacterium]|nr:30S ribosome-binding factor RbfA [Alphaproteobacteria bacterium]